MISFCVHFVFFTQKQQKQMPECFDVNNYTIKLWRT